MNMIEQWPIQQAAADIVKRYPALDLAEAYTCVDLDGVVSWLKVGDILAAKRKARAATSTRERRAAPKTAYVSEGAFTSAMLKELRKLPRTKWWRCNTGRRAGITFGDQGAPDLMGILPGGRFIGVELKMPGGKVHASQQRWIDHARELGAICIVGSDMATIIQEVAALL